jgi:hypothetical protein
MKLNSSRPAWKTVVFSRAAIARQNGITSTSCGSITAISAGLTTWIRQSSGW